jgi:hypothetical protein
VSLLIWLNARLYPLERACLLRIFEQIPSIVVYFIDRLKITLDGPSTFKGRCSRCILAFSYDNKFGFFFMPADHCSIVQDFIEAECLSLGNLDFLLHLLMLDCWLAAWSGIVNLG